MRRVILTGVPGTVSIGANASGVDRGGRLIYAAISRCLSIFACVLFLVGSNAAAVDLHGGDILVTGGSGAIH
jgi:hypothetical protein